MTTMQVKDIMSRNVIWVGTEESVLKAARLMLQNHISGLPVIDMNGKLAGIVTEGDFLRRSEIGTERHRPRWLEFLVGPGKLAEEYAHASGRKIEEIMTADPYTVSETDSLETVVELMERYHIKRLPVLAEGRMVGIVSRANLMHEMARRMRLDTQASSGPDWWIRSEILSALGKQTWAPDIKVDVKCGVVELSGVIMAEKERQGLVVLVENVPGVKKVHDHLVWVEPMSAMAFPSPEDEKAERRFAQGI
jgi:CBS domain-containing protein